MHRLRIARTALVIVTLVALLAAPAAVVMAGTFGPVTATDQTATAPLANPNPASFQPRYISGFGSGDSFTVFFEDRDAGNVISYVSTTTGPTGFPASVTATDITDTHFVVKDWPINLGGTDYAYRAWGAVGNNLNHHFYVSNDLANWTLKSTFTIPNAPGFTDAHGWVYYGFHDVIQLNGTYYAFAESNQSQTMLVRSANGDDVWEAFASVGGRPGWGPLELPAGVSFGWTPSGSFVDLGRDRGYGKIHVDPRDNNFYLAVNTAAKPSLPPADLEAAFINPANWTWHDGTTGPAASPILSATSEHDLRECWVVPNTDPDADWVIVYDADFGSADGGKALGYATLTPPPPPPDTVYVDDDYDAAGCTADGHTWQVDCFDVVQDGLDAVTPGGTVHVAAGTYAERLTIIKSVDLRGAQYGVDPTATGARTDPDTESVITEAGLSTPNPDVLIEIPTGVTGVAVDGFTLTGDQTNTTADTSVVRCWGDDVTISNNVIDGMYAVLYKGGDGLTVHRNRVIVNKVGVTVQPNPASNVTVSDNVFSLGSSPAGGESAIYMTSCSQCSVTGNAASGFVDGRGFGGSNLSHLTVSGNTFTGNKDAVSFWGNTTFVDITSNVLSDSSRYGINMKGQDVTIQGNEISGNGEAGINVARHVIDTERVAIHCNVISGNANFGVQVDTANVAETIDAEDNWWGDASGPLDDSDDVAAGGLYNPTGLGDSVTDGVDYDPWATSTPPCEPTAICLASFTAEASAGSVALTWETAAEIDNAGFNLYRAAAPDGPYTRVNGALIAAQGSPVSGASYSFVDKGLAPGTYTYKLEDVDLGGVTTLHGPVSAPVVPRLRRPSYRPTLP
jgi:hypothetical protein